MTKKIERVIITGGGTGGHIYPAVSIYQKLKAENPNLEALYIGTEKGLESSLIPQYEIPFQSIQISGLKRSLSLENVKTFWELITSTYKVKKTIQSFDPDLVIGTGGYVAGPVLLAAALAKYPTFIHEQNSKAGLTNKFLARVVDRVGICFPDVSEDFSSSASKLVLTGNPRGQEVADIEKSPSILAEQFGLDDQKPTVLIFGGSRGAPAINQTALESLTKWLEVVYQVIIVTGNVHYETLKDQYLQDFPSTSNVRVVPYIENMPLVLKSIDLVVSRSGATTITELTALGLPSILIPSPYVTANHQEHNGQSLVDAGACLMIKETELNGDILFRQVNELMLDDERRKLMGEQSYGLGIRDALDRIYDTLLEMI